MGITPRVFPGRFWGDFGRVWGQFSGCFRAVLGSRPGRTPGVDPVRVGVDEVDGDAQVRLGQEVVLVLLLQGRGLVLHEPGGPKPPQKHPKSAQKPTRVST